MSKKEPPKNNLPEPVELPMTVAELARKTGLTESAIRWYIASGQWREKEHFYRKGRRLMMVPSACVNFWMETKK